MQKKIIAGAFAAAALSASIAGPTAFAQENGASASAHARIDASGRLGLRGIVDKLIERHEDNRGGREDHRDDGDADRADRFGIAVVTDIDTDAVTASQGDVTWTVFIDNDTRFSGSGTRSEGDLEIGDRIAVTGTVTDGEGDQRAIEARSIARLGDKVRAAGTVTAVDNSAQTVTVATKHQGELTVAVDSSTTIADGSDSGTFADLMVGTRVHVKGMWDSLRSMVSAAKVRIMATL